MLTGNELSVMNLERPAEILLPKEGDPENLVSLGLFRTTDEFVKEACNLQHPFDSSSAVPDDTKKAIFRCLTLGREGIRYEREQTFKHYERLAESLRETESSLHDAMDADREQIVHDKQFLLYKHMCRDAGVGDDFLSDLMMHGVSLTGVGPKTQQFEDDAKKPAISEVQLMRSSRWTRPKLLGSQAGVQEIETRRELWQRAMDEVGKGWLRGPLTEAQVAGQLGPLFVVSRRFGLTQSDKVRPIDDLSESLVNSAYGSSYRLDLPGVDGISLVARTMIEAVKDDGTVVLTLSDGSSLNGYLHNSMSVREARTLVGRTLDLDAAYKQMLVAKQSLWASVLAIEDPDGYKRLFVSNVLPFGASSSVYAFNLVARSLHAIGERLFGLIWCNYYDDYPQLDIAGFGGDAQICAERFLKLLGWRSSEKPHKRLPFAESFEALGVLFDLSSSINGKIVVRNKPSRVSQICDEVDAVLAAGSFTPAQATALRGKLQFAETHTFCRALASNLRAFQRRACGKLPGSHLTPELEDELVWAKKFMVRDCPRTLSVDMSKYRIVLFTDASLEMGDTVGRIGLVCFLVHDGHIIHKYFFSEMVPADVMSM
eukprot:Skav216067  [mRNA]  locus=scaffold389:28036:29832:+ [translate_table: standard]